jgi:hypothetical protein
VPSFSMAVLAVLVDDRHRAIAYDFARARRLRLRRRLAAAAYGLAGAANALGSALDEDRGTVQV